MPDKIKIKNSKDGHIESVDMHNRSLHYEYSKSGDTYDIRANSQHYGKKSELEVLDDISQNLKNYKQELKGQKVVMTVTSADGKGKDLDYNEAVSYVDKKAAELTIKNHKNEKGFSGKDLEHVAEIVKDIRYYNTDNVQGHKGVDGDEIASIKEKARKYGLNIGDLKKGDKEIDIFKEEKGVTHHARVAADITDTKVSKGL